MTTYLNIPSEKWSQRFFQDDYDAAFQAVEPIVFASSGAWKRLTGVDPALTDSAWSSANQAVYVPIFLPFPGLSAQRLMIYPGTVGGGNVDVGIYLPDSDRLPGEKIVSIGSTSYSVDGEMIIYTIAETPLPAGLLYVAAAFDGTTARVRACATAVTNGFAMMTGNVFTEASAFPLPADATPSTTPTAATVPIVSVGVI